MPGTSIVVTSGGVTKSYALEEVGSSGVTIDYVPTDEDLEKLAGMINSGIPQEGVLFTDGASGKVYRVHVSSGRLTMTSIESEG